MNSSLFHILQYVKRKVIIPINRMRLHNSNFTIISNNCAGGIMYHDLGERFNSPTVNLMFYASDFFTFLENLHEALESDVVECKNAGGVSCRIDKAAQWARDKDKLHALSNL